MDHDWTPKSSRPSKLYRVYRPFQYTTLSHRGLRASNTSLHYPLSTHYSQFLASLVSHRMQAWQPSPYISFFSSLTEAESWALAAEDEFLKPAFVLEIDVTHKAMEGAKMWRVQDIQTKTGKQLGLGGVRNSEWLVLHHVPGVAISRAFKSSTDIRIERGIPFPVYVENPNSRIDDIPYDERLFQGCFYIDKPLQCGCADERRCIHFQWLESAAGEDEDFWLSNVQILEGVRQSGEPDRQSLDSGVEMGADGPKIARGHAVSMEQRSSGDSDVAMGGERVQTTPGPPFLSGGEYENAEIVTSNEGTHTPESNPPSMDEDHDLAVMALAAFRAQSPAAFSSDER